MADPRESLGRLVREVWVQWASEQPDPKASWLMPWIALDDGQREVDMRIGAAVASAEHALSGHAEWLCHRCQAIHPPQPGLIMVHPCPDCGTVMLPTSASRRVIERLRAALAAGTGDDPGTSVKVSVCTACGSVIGQEPEDWARHENWHRLLRNLTAGGEPLPDLPPKEGDHA